MASNLYGEQNDMPQWKKDLILRRRNQNRQSSLSESNSCSNSSNSHMATSGARKEHQHSPTSCGASTVTADAVDVVGTSTSSSSSGQQPSPTIANIDVQHRSNSPKPCVIRVTSPVPRVPATTMVQERAWIDHGVNVLVKKTTSTIDNNSHPPTSATTMDTNGASADKNSLDSDSSEELQYGPGIVNKLKNRYLSLTLRESNNRRNRPSILSIMHMRKAASLENLLEDDTIKSPINNSNCSNGNKATTFDGQHPLHPYERCNSNNYRSVNGNGTASSNGTSAADAAATTVRNASNRYRKPARGHDLMMKRAHSVETISLRSSEDSLLQEPEVVVRQMKCESMYDNNMLLIRSDEGNYNKKEITVINDYQNAKFKKTFDSGVAVNNIPTPRVNRPTKIKPVMNEKEKPPADVVKETKKKFEGRPDMRTRPPHQTGDVAAKVATYSNIIVKTKVNKMPLSSKYHKPSVVSNKSWPEKKESKPMDLNIDHKWTNNPRTKTLNSPDVAMVSPIPDVSRVMDNFDKFEREHKVNSSLCETPDLLLHSSPVHTPVNLQSNHLNDAPLFNNCRERQDSDSTNSSQPLSPASECSQDDSSSEDTVHSIRISPESQQNISSSSKSEAFNFNTILMAGTSHLPVVDKKPPTPPHHKAPIQHHQNLSHTEPLHVEVHNSHKTVPKQAYEQLLKKSPTNGDTTPVLSPISPTLTSREIQKNNINAAKSREVSLVPVLLVDSSVSSVPKSSIVSTSVVSENVSVSNAVPKPKKSVPRPQDTTTLFDFTHRNDVPDYVRNDGTTRNIDVTKSRDSGTTLLPGFEEDLDIDLSSPPSPCDVTFINDNVLISGRSSICKRASKRASLQKVRLQFNTSPEVFEYPSEKSILGEDKEDITSPTVGHAIPLLSGSTLANYQPKSGFSIEDFQLGVTKTATVSTHNAPSGTAQEEAKTESQMLSEVHEPIMFSAGTNSDILF